MPKKRKGARGARQDDGSKWLSVKVPAQLLENARRTRAKLMKTDPASLPEELANVVRLDLKRVGIGQVLVLADKALNHLLDGGSAAKTKGLPF